MILHVGQKVVCVDDRIPTLARCLRWMFGWPWRLKRGEIYTIAGRLTAYGEPLVTLVELKNPPLSEGAFFARRFRPLVENKTDISVFTEMLTDKPAKVTA